MFGKLLKYDLKETGRSNLLICGIAAFIELFNLFLIWLCLYAYTHTGSIYFLDVLDLDLISTLVVEVILVVAVILPIAVTILSLVYFIKTSYGQSGYLTRLIPVKQTSVFNSKLLTVFLWTLAALLISLLSIAALIWIATALNGDEFSFILSIFGLDFEEIWKSIPAETKWTVGLSILPFSLILIFSVIMLFIYAFTMAQKRPFRRMGFGGIMIWIGIIYLAEQLFILLCLVFPWQLALDSNNYLTVIISELWLGVSEGYYADPAFGISLLFFIAPPVWSLISYLYCKKEYSVNINMK